MKLHIITKEDMDYKATVRMASSFNKSEEKTLEFVFNPGRETFLFVVRSYGKVVQESSSIEKAIDKYNEC